MNKVKEAEGQASRPGAGARRRRSWGAIAWLALAVAVLVAAGAAVVSTMGGWPGSPRQAPSARPAATSAASSPSASPTPTRPALARFDPAAPEGDNLQLFRGVLEKAARSTAAGSVTAKTLTDALLDAGFAAGSVQRTADQTSAKLQAPMLTVSVRLGAVCLIGQFDRSDASISTQLAAPIGTGACLIGETAPFG